jgi:hypothetical protein
MELAPYVPPEADRRQHFLAGILQAYPIHMAHCAYCLRWVRPEAPESHGRDCQLIAAVNLVRLRRELLI